MSLCYRWVLLLPFGPLAARASSDSWRWRISDVFQFCFVVFFLICYFGLRLNSRQNCHQLLWFFLSAFRTFFLNSIFVLFCELQSENNSRSFELFVSFLFFFLLVGEFHFTFSVVFAVHLRSDTNNKISLWIEFDLYCWVSAILGWFRIWREVNRIKIKAVVNNLILFGIRCFADMLHLSSGFFLCFRFF